MTKPNLFIIGAPKCGTTSLYDWLAQHPQIFMSSFKEPHYFNTDDTFRFVKDADEYLKLFELANNEHQIVGEASTWYLFSKTAVPRIECYTSKSAKYIVCLRDPIGMVQSLHAQNVFSGNESVPNFEKAWKLQGPRSRGKMLPMFTNAASHLQYYDVCALGAMVENLLKNVARDRVHFILLEDMIADPEGEYAKVLRFLNISSPSSLIDFAAQNSSHRPKSILVTRLISLGSMIRRMTGVKRGFGILTWMRSANKLEKPRTKISSGMIHELSQAFLTDILKLEKVLGRDLSHWRNR